MANFATAAKITMKHEGGYVVDVGGPTKYGVSQKAHKELSTEQVKALTPETALPFYVPYWSQIRGEAINDQACANVFFDFYFNGPAGAKNAAIDSLVVLGEPRSKLTSMAAIVEAINRHSAKFPAAFTTQRINFYRRLATGKNAATYSRYLAGWIKRAQSFFKMSVAMKAGIATLVLAFGLYAYRHTQTKGG